MSILLSRMIHPLTSLGPGRRLGIWVQGCTIGCPGCISKDTWNKDAGVLVDEQQLAINVVEIIIREKLDGISLTGGEPTDQSCSLCQFLKIVLNQIPQINIIMFSGVDKERLLNDFADLTQCIDLAVCGPYITDLPSDRPLIASDNQQFVSCSAHGDKLLSMIMEDGSKHEIQFGISRDNVVMAGLPFPDEMIVLEDELQKKGIVFSEVSWIE